MPRRRFPVLALALMGCSTLLVIAGCRPAADEPSTSAANEAEAPVRDGPPALPVPEPPMSREEMLMAVIRASSAASAGTDDREAQAELPGKRFALRVRFGCEGQSIEGPRRWSYDEGNGTLRVLVQPEHGSGQASGADAGSEANLYTVNRPWMMDAACPASVGPAPPADAGEGAGNGVGPVAAAPTEAGGKVTLVQRFGEEESRASRLPAEFRLVKRVSPEVRPTQGLDFVLLGRLTEGPDGRVIACSAPPGDGRPDCLVSVAIDSARVQEPVSGEVLSSWGDP